MNSQQPPQVTFVGGPHDGQTQPLAEPFTLGSWFIAEVPGSLKRAIYSMRADGKFHFIGNGSTADFQRGMAAIHKFGDRLLAITAELEAECERINFFPPGSVMNGWMLIRLLPEERDH